MKPERRNGTVKDNRNFCVKRKCDIDIQVPRIPDPTKLVWVDACSNGTQNCRQKRGRNNRKYERIN